MLTRAWSWISGRRLLLLLLAGSAAAAAAGRSELARKEREIVFRIEPGVASWYQGLPHGVQEVELPLQSEAGSQAIHGWWWPAATRDAPALLYLHGSRWNLTGQMTRISQLHDFGFSVLAIDYRGFGKSAGELPSESTVYQDAQVAWQHLSRLQPDAARRYIYGHSLGGAVAVELARGLSTEARQEGGAARAAGLIVESSFTSLAQVAAAITETKWPIRWILSQKFDSIDKIAEVGLPVLLVHGTGDRFVPARFSEQLYAAAAEPKRLLLIEGGSHNTSMRTGNAEYRNTLREFFGLGKGPGVRKATVT